MSTANANNNQLFNNNNNNFVSNQQITPTNIQTFNQAQAIAPNPDAYGTPQGNVITGTNINNFGRGNVDNGLTNSVSASLTFPTSSSQFAGNNLNNNNLGNSLTFQSTRNPFLTNSINNNNNNLVRG